MGLACVLPPLLLLGLLPMGGRDFAVGVDGSGFPPLPPPPPPPAPFPEEDVGLRGALAADVGCGLVDILEVEVEEEGGLAVDFLGGGDVGWVVMGFVAVVGVEG